MFYEIMRVNYENPTLWPTLNIKLEQSKINGGNKNIMKDTRIKIQYL